MDPALLLAVQIGVFQLLIDFGQPVLSLIAWGLLLGCGILQYFLLHKGCRKIKWLFPALLLLILIICEVGCAVNSGWDIFIWIIAYGYCFIALIGALIAWLLYKFKHNKKSVS